MFYLEEHEKRGEKRVENEEKMYFSSKNRQVKKKRKMIENEEQNVFHFEEHTSKREKRKTIENEEQQILLQTQKKKIKRERKK